MKMAPGLFVIISLTTVTFLTEISVLNLNVFLLIVNVLSRMIATKVCKSLLNLLLVNGASGGIQEAARRDLKPLPLTCA